MPDNATQVEFDRQLIMVQAAMLAEIAESEDFPIAHPSLLQKDITGLLKTTCLTMLDSQIVGYPLADELLPLAYMLNKLPRPEIDPTLGITHHDELMDDANAHLHDRLLNVVLPFDVKSHINLDSEPLNNIYEDFLVHSDFAGRVSSSSAAKTSAMELLFPEDENGIPTQSTLYKTYSNLKNIVDQLSLEVEMHRNAGDTAQKDIAEGKLLQKKAELETLGQRKRVETALALISSADADAGFEDEREGYRNLFEARRRERISEGLSYQTAKIRPLEPLFDFVGSTLWRSINLDKGQIKQRLNNQIQRYFNIAAAEVQSFSEMSPKLSFEYVVCDVSREWWSRKFISAKHWDNSRTLSDGKGGGEIPTEPRKLVFIRAVKLSAQDSLTLLPTDMAKIATVAPTMTTLDVASRRKAPLLMKMQALQLKPAMQAQFKALDIMKFNKASAVSKSDIVKMRAVTAPAKAKRAAPAMSKPTAKAKPVTKAQLDAHFMRARTPKIMALKNPRSMQVLQAVQAVQVNAAKPKQSDRAAIINGKIRLEGDIDPNHVIVRLHEMEGRSLRQTRFPLMDKGQNEYWFNGHAFRLIKNRAKNGRPATKYNAIAFKVEIIYKGQVLIDEYFAYTDKTKTHDFDWVIKPNMIEIQLADSQQPSLFAYGIRLNPQSPNPDPKLNWTGAI